MLWWPAGWMWVPGNTCRHCGGSFKSRGDPFSQSVEEFIASIDHTFKPLINSDWTCTGRIPFLHGYTDNGKHTWLTEGLITTDGH